MTNDERESEQLWMDMADAIMRTGILLTGGGLISVTQGWRMGMPLLIVGVGLVFLVFSAAALGMWIAVVHRLRSRRQGRAS